MKTRGIKKAVLAVCILLLFTICVGMLAGCSNSGKTKETKYDVAIRVGCSDGNIYEFPVGTDELHIEIPYDGIERRYGVKAYNLPDHPRWSKEWFSPSGEGANVFSISLGKVNQRYDEEDPKCVCDKGEYIFFCAADSTSTLWNYRAVWLYIEIK
ncbi:MAG: hypothetical protein ACI4MH_01180 [Candidatus Coproplasma sp.]